MHAPEPHLASVMVDPLWTVPPALLAAFGLAWYWLRLGREDVPPSRRRLRRLTIVLLGVSLPILISAMSVLNPDHEPRRFIVTWTVAIFIMFMVMLLALLDAINSLRLHHRAVQQDLREAADELVRAAMRRQEDLRASREHHQTHPGKRRGEHET